jgi:hypothetical protein
MLESELSGQSRGHSMTKRKMIACLAFTAVWLGVTHSSTGVGLHDETTERVIAPTVVHVAPDAGENPFDGWSDATTFVFEGPATPPRSLSLTIPIEGVERSIDLTRRDRDPSFRILEGGSDGFSTRNRGVEGLIETENGDRFFVQRMEDDRGTHVLYRASVPERDALCDAVMPDFVEESDEPFHGGLAGAIQRTLRIAIEADHAFQVLNGSDPEQAVADVESVHNVTALVYERDVELDVILTTIILRDAPSSYQGSTTAELLCDMSDFWRQGYLEGLGDTIQLMSGLELEGPIGSAFVDSTCSGSIAACGQNTNFWSLSVTETLYSANLDKRIALSAHEIGHGIGAPHCSGGGCHIMCSSIGQCGGVSGSNLQFGFFSSLAIDLFVQDAACLPETNRLELPFEDMVLSTAIDSQKWAHWNFAETRADATASPAATRAISLFRNGPSGSAFPDIPASLTSQTFEMSRYTNAVMSFWCRHWNTGASADLVVEYLDSDREWNTLGSVGADDANSPHFSVFLIPDDAGWDGMRLRFSSAIGGPSTSEIWAIDEIKVWGEERIGTLNDDCSSPTPVQSGLVSFDTVEATDSIQQDDCSGTDTLPITADNWYEYTAECSGELLVVTCGLVDFDARAAAYLASDCTDGEMTPIGCDDPDDVGCEGVFGSTLRAQVTEGLTYLIRIGSPDGTTGSGLMFIGCTPDTTPPCPEDLDGDGSVGGSDIAMILGAWGTPDADIDGNGTTGGSDLALVLGSWGDCPR